MRARSKPAMRRYRRESAVEKWVKGIGIPLLFISFWNPTGFDVFNYILLNDAVLTMARIFVGFLYGVAFFFLLHTAWKTLGRWGFVLYVVGAVIAILLLRQLGWISFGQAEIGWFTLIILIGLGYMALYGAFWYYRLTGRIQATTYDGDMD